MFGFGGAKKELLPPSPDVTGVSASDLAFQLSDASFWLESITILMFSRDGSFTNISFAVVRAAFSSDVPS